MPSLHDVARIAGVSKSTVSRVINNEGSVNSGTRAKVLAAIQQTGFVLNQVAKDLKSQRTNLVGVIVPRITSHAVAAGVEGLSAVVEAAGMHVLLANSRLVHNKESEFIELFNQKRVAGIIIFATHVNESLLAEIRQSRAPVVVVGQDFSRFGIPSVVHDDFGVGIAAAQHLYDAGCRQFGFIGVRADDIAVDQLRYAGFATQTRQLIGSEPLFHSHGDFSVLSGRQQMAEQLRIHPECDGLFCATDDLAIGASQVLRENGIVAGHQVKLVSVGNDDKAALVTPSLTSFAYAFEGAGREAASLLLDLCHERKKAITKLMLGFSLMSRESCPAP
ncbi:MAG: LacI family DNA-binding transcriptional regulator [Gammaproteobacteria bacterium]|nr:LacI family DNA-binding transcriptional regulator [Gammaproteobacteria bacterium]